METYVSDMNICNNNYLFRSSFFLFLYQQQSTNYNNMSFMCGFVVAAILAWLLVGVFLDDIDAKVNNKESYLQRFCDWLKSKNKKED